MKRLAIITTHPIQYNAPLFRLLHERKNIEIKIFYTWSQTAQGTKYDPGFKKQVEWDIPLLDGYPYTFVENISASPGSAHNKGIDNPTLVKEVEAWNPSAVLVYGWNFKSHLAAMRYFHGKMPVIFRGDSTLIDETPGIKKILRRLYLRYIFRSVDLALYAGKANRDYFIAHGLKEDQLLFMPHAIDNRRFAKSDENIAASKKLREALNIPETSLIFLSAGKLEEKKQPGLLAEIFVRLAAKDTYLVIAGSGELEEKLHSLYGDNEHIRFTGFLNQQQMPALYGACDVFVLPSKGPGETWGLAVNEAMAAGKAVLVSSACGAAADLVQNGVNGFVFEKNDRDAAEKYLRYFSDHRAAVKEMGRESELMIANYNFMRDADAVERAVEKTMKGV